MAENNPSNSDHQLSDKLTKAAKTVTVGGLLLMFSPVLIMFSPMLVPAYIVYWLYRYVTGKHPAGSDQVAKAQGKISDAAADVKNKVVQAGEKVLDTAEDVKNKVAETGQKIVDAAEDLAKNNVVTKAGEKVVETAEDLVKDGVSTAAEVAEGAKNAVEKLGQDIFKLGGGGGK
ncbi:hypothetical protein L6452_31406 [Arctium lappa]|uniref:Uncharacterized protein n=1 Tax=Arctium lappa TaxID=4217 RepID=A0ACB8Z1S8_ARCLA|nr:hypothetical protein L6452_31406 [Arctium lappa]